MIDRASVSQWPPAALPHLARLTTLGELTTLIARELSQPLASISANGRASLRWLDGPSPGLDAARINVEAMVNGAHRARQIIQRLYGLSRRARSGRNPLLLNDVIHDVLPLIAAELKIRDVMLQLDVAADLPLVLGDRVQLQQVLLNLLLNAMHAMALVPPGQRELMVGSHYTREQVLITVRDSGTGLDPVYIERLFEPLFTTRADGIGIGLSVCQSIVEAHGGRIWATRNPEPGATFKFALPIKR